MKRIIDLYKYSSLASSAICFLIFSITSCGQSLANKAEAFDSNYIYKTPADIQRFELLKNKFLSLWKDSSNCYDNGSRLKRAWWNFYTKDIKDAYVDNILSTSSGDTLIVLFTGYAVDTNSDVKQERTFSIGMGVIIDSLNQWHFACNGGTFWIESSYENHKQQILQLREVILKAGYLDDKGNPSPVFWKKLYANKLW